MPSSEREAHIDRDIIAKPDEWPQMSYSSSYRSIGYHDHNHPQHQHQYRQQQQNNVYMYQQNNSIHVPLCGSMELNGNSLIEKFELEPPIDAGTCNGDSEHEYEMSCDAHLSNNHKHAHEYSRLVATIASVNTHQICSNQHRQQSQFKQEQPDQPTMTTSNNTNNNNANNSEHRELATHFGVAAHHYPFAHQTHHIQQTDCSIQSTLSHQTDSNNSSRRSSTTGNNNNTTTSDNNNDNNNNNGNHQHLNSNHLLHHQPNNHSVVSCLEQQNLGSSSASASSSSSSSSLPFFASTLDSDTIDLLLAEQAAIAVTNAGLLEHETVSSVGSSHCTSGSGLNNSALQSDNTSEQGSPTNASMYDPWIDCDIDIASILQHPSSASTTTSTVTSTMGLIGSDNVMLISNPGTQRTIVNPVDTCNAQPANSQTSQNQISYRNSSSASSSSAGSSLATSPTCNGPKVKSTRCRNIAGYVLTDEEKKLLIKEGYTDFPLTCQDSLPLSKNEERILRKIRRKIRNKRSAQCSRQRKKEYVEDLEHRYTTILVDYENFKKEWTRLKRENESLLKAAASR